MAFNHKNLHLDSYISILQGARIFRVVGIGDRGLGTSSDSRFNKSDLFDTCVACLAKSA